MALPKLTALTQTHTITLSPELDVCFQIVPIPGSKYQQIIDDGRIDDGTTPWETVAVELMTVGIESVYTSVESSPVQFTVEDALEVWTEWPEWARWSIYQAVISYSTKGPAGNPFGGLTQKDNAAT